MITLKIISSILQVHRTEFLSIILRGHFSFCEMSYGKRSDNCDFYESLC